MNEWMNVPGVSSNSIEEWMNEWMFLVLAPTV